MNNAQYLTNTHILKILFNPKTPNMKGIKCFPQQTYGISLQSPDNFHQTYGLKAQNGYLYQQQQQRENKQLYSVPFCQQKYCSVIGDTTDIVGDLREEYYKQIEKDKQRFHRRRGRLSQFMQKNAWMKQMRPLMGFERDSQARKASNNDRDLKTKSARRPIPYINPVQKKIPISKQWLLNNSNLLTQRAKLRTKRLSLHSQKRDALDLQKYIKITSKKSPQKDPYIDVQNLTNRMSKTTNSKQWRTTMSTIRQKFRKQQDISQIMNLTNSDWSKNNQSVCLKHEPFLQKQKDELKEWYNTTCNTKANPWRYRKARKMVTGSDEQLLD